MTASLGSAVYELTTDHSKFDAGLKRAEGEAKSSTSRIGGIFDAFGKIGLGAMGVQAVVGTVQGIIGPFIGANVELQNFRNTLTTVYQTAAGSEAKAIEMAEETLTWAKNFANVTPFETKDVIEATVRMQAYGLSAKDTLESTGNMASAMGKPLMQAVEAIADAQTGELERLKEFGITKKMLIDQAAKMGEGEIVNAQGQITNMEAMNRALFGLMDERFKGGMERQSKGFTGMISNVQAVLSEFTLTVGAPIFDKVSEWLGGLLTLLSEHQADVTAFGQAIGNAVAGGFALLERALNAVLPPLQTVFDWVQKFFNYFQANNDFDFMRAVFGADLGPKIDNVVREIKGIINVITAMVDAILHLDFGDFEDMLGELQADASNMVDGLLDIIKTALPKIVSKLAEWAGAFLSWIAPLIGPFLTQLAGIWLAMEKWILGVYVQIGAKLLEWGKAFVEWIGPQIQPFIAELAKLADRFVAWIGEQAPPILKQLGEWADAFVAWIVPMTTTFLAQWPGMLSRFLDWIAEAVPPILGKLLEWASTFISWVAPLIPPLLLALAGVAAAILAFVAETVITIGAKLLTWGLEFVQWVAPLIGPLLGKLGELLGAMLGWMGETGLPLLIAKLKEWGAQFWEWVGPQIPPLLEQLAFLLAGLGGWITNTAVPQLGVWALALGKALVQGILDGLAGLANAVGKRLSDSIENALQMARDTLGIHSPSKVMQIIGEQMIEGLTLGITNAGRTFNEVFHRVFDETFEWWDREGLNLFDFMRAQAEQFARDQASNLAFIFDEMKGGRRGIEDLMKVLDQMYGGLAKIVSPLTDIIDLLAGPTIQQYEDQIKAVNDSLKAQDEVYKEQLETLQDQADYRRMIHDSEMKFLDGEIRALQEKILLEQGPFLDERNASSEEYQKLQAEIHKADLYFAREREKAAAAGDKKRLADLKLEEDSYRDSKRARLDTLRAEMQVATDQIDAVAKRHEAEMKALTDEKATKGELWKAELDFYKTKKEGIENVHAEERARAAERIKEIEAEEKAALKANETIKGLLATISALQAKTAELELIKTVALIANTISSAGMAIPQAVLDAFAALPRAAGGMLDSMINALLAAYGRGLYGAGAPAVPQFALGGIVPGALGQPQLVMAHGGEEITPVGQSRSVIYNLTANYKYQDERSLRDDVRLLQLMGAAT